MLEIVDDKKGLRVVDQDGPPEFFVDAIGSKFIFMISGDGSRFTIYQAKAVKGDMAVINRANYAFSSDAIKHWSSLMTARDKAIREAKIELLKSNIETMVQEINDNQEQLPFNEEKKDA